MMLKYTIFQLVMVYFSRYVHEIVDNFYDCIGIL